MPNPEKYIRGKDPVVLSACAFFKLNCRVASRRRSPGGVVVRALLLALHDKDNSFFVKSGTVIFGELMLIGDIKYTRNKSFSS